MGAFNPCQHTLETLCPQHGIGDSIPTVKRFDRLLIMMGDKRGEFYADEIPFPFSPNAIVATISEVTYFGGYFHYKSDVGEFDIRRDILIHFVVNLKS